MREIKFRGKAKLSIEELDEMSLEHENGWVYGNLIVNGKNPFIVGNLVEIDSEYIVHEFWTEVHPDSIGQYTGLKDDNYEPPKEIYHGDFLEDFINKKRYEVIWDDYGMWLFNPIGVEGCGIDYYEFEDEVTSATIIIGNRFENPELLGEQS